MNVDWDEAPEGANIYAEGTWFKEAAPYFLRFDEGRWECSEYSSLSELAVCYSGIQVKFEDEEVPKTAGDFLGAALGHLEDRAATYDSPQGERSMGRTVEAFNAITGHKLSEEQGWLFMVLLKAVRSQQGKYKSDNFEDLIAYGALQGECAAKERT